jgi:hypothetical protein
VAGHAGGVPALGEPGECDDAAFDGQAAGVAGGGGAGAGGRPVAVLAGGAGEGVFAGGFGVGEGARGGFGWFDD